MVSAEINGTRRIDCDPCPERIKWIIHDRRWVGILDSIGVLVVFVLLTACVTYLVRFYNTKWRTRTLSVQRKSSIIVNVYLSLCSLDDGVPARHPLADNFADRVLENYCKDYHRSPKVSNEVYALKTPGSFLQDAGHH